MNVRRRAARLLSTGRRGLLSADGESTARLTPSNLALEPPPRTTLMPIFDLPVDQLRLYTGRNPRPSDFDAYWSQALADLDQVDPAVQIAPVPHPTPVADLFDLYFIGVGGARIFAKYLRPRGVSDAP